LAGGLRRRVVAARTWELDRLRCSGCGDVFTAQAPPEAQGPKFDETAVAIQTGGAIVEGTFDTIDETGCMMVRTSAGKQVPISAGDVYFGSAASAGAA